MYDLTWKFDTPQEMVESGRALGQLVQDEVAVLHGPKAAIRGIAIFDDERRLVDLRVIALAENGEEEMTILEDNPDECLMAPIERSIKSLGCTDFVLWQYGDDSGTSDMAVIELLDELGQSIIDTQLPHGIGLRAVTYVGRTKGHGAMILSPLARPTVGSPSFMYGMSKHSLGIELQRAPDDRSQVVIDAMLNAMESLVKHVPFDHELMDRAQKVAAARLREKALADPTLRAKIPQEVLKAIGLDNQTQPRHRAASPFDLPELKLPDPEKGLLN